MKKFNNTILETLPSRYRANLINSCTGYKSLNLIGTKSSNGQENVAIFNSIIHLGSNPALIGFTFRPLTVQRDTYRHIKETQCFTVNQVQHSFISKAHQTAAKYPTEISEFAATGLDTEYLDGHKAPFVKESTIKYSATYIREHFIAENGCVFIIGAIQNLYAPEAHIAPDGWINLTQAHAVAGIGIDGYAFGAKTTRFEYATPYKEPKIKP